MILIWVIHWEEEKVSVLEPQLELIGGGAVGRGGRWGAQGQSFKETTEIETPPLAHTL